MLHTIQNKFLTVTVSELGAELQSILGADGTEYLWQGNPAYWKGRSPILFPFIGRLTDKKYWLDGKEYEIGIHGFARNSVFLLERQTETELVFLLRDNEEIYASYPRHFAFRVIYTLEDNLLSVCCQVNNEDDRQMYFAVGGHPGFCVPLKAGVAFEDYCLRFAEGPMPKRHLLAPSYLISGETEDYPLVDGCKLPLHHDLFDDDALILSGMSREVTLETPGDSHGVTVSFPQLPYLGLWHMPHTDAPYVCIEPWYTLPATDGSVTVLEQREDMVKLAPGGEYRNTWSVRCF
jgi:galactose mutarotase-like enzyme